jgi:hypothetical protein
VQYAYQKGIIVIVVVILYVGQRIPSVGNSLWNSKCVTVISVGG